MRGVLGVGFLGLRARGVVVVLGFFQEELTVTAHLAFEVFDLGEGGVLAACAEEVAQVGEGDATVTALVEEGEGLLEVCALRLLVGHVVLVVGGIEGVSDLWAVWTGDF